MSSLDLIMSSAPETEDVDKDAAKEPSRDEKAEGHNSSSSDDDDSSSSSSGSSSSSSDSDSDSDGEGGEGATANGEDGNGHRREKPRSDSTSSMSSQLAGRKYSMDSHVSSSASIHGSASSSSLSAIGGGGASNGLSNHRSDAREKAIAEPLNVNSTLAASRFRKQANTETGLMALGTKKRDRRTIEEIQRDMRIRGGRNGNGATPPLAAGASSLGGATKKHVSGVVVPTARSIPVARASPPKSSPIMSPESGAEVEKLNLGGAMNSVASTKSKANTSRSRLEKRLAGRGGSRSGAAVAKPKPKTNASAPPTGIVTNISVGKVIKPGGSSNHSGDSPPAMDAKIDTSPTRLSSKATPVDTKPDGRVIRAVLRVLLRYGDLTDVNLVPGDHHKSFADEYKSLNFILRSNLHTTLKMSEDKLITLACEIVDQAERTLEEKKDTMKFADVEIKPSQVVERLFENFKLRIAVQQALREIDASPSKGGAAVYALVSRHHDTSILGIGRDFSPWTWAEKEHDWNNKKDMSLLLGIYLYGFGAWEDILNDDRLLLQHQRALKGERLKKRSENLLKRLPPPENFGEPRIVSLATALTSAGQISNQSLGKQFSAIINGTTGKGGRMQRAADRVVARSGAGDGHNVHDDSIRKSRTQANNAANDNHRVRKPSITSSVVRDDGDPEDGEVGSAVNETPRQESISKRSASKDDKRRQRNGDEDNSPRKKSKQRHESSSRRSISQSEQSTSMGKHRRLAEEEYIEKWKPNKRLRDIKQELKKMKIMSEWSKDQNDEVVVEKVYKYVTTIGEAIDQIVVEMERQGKFSSNEWDEFCSALWTYAAGSTPFSAVVFERLYDDICADGARLREEEQQKGRRVTSATSS